MKKFSNISELNCVNNKASIFSDKTSNFYTQLRTEHLLNNYRIYQIPKSF